jgi:GNAT superfamily N-acetyltransferase
MVGLREQWRLESHHIELGSDPTFAARFLAWFNSERAAGSLTWVAENLRIVGMLVMFVHQRMPEPARPTTSWGYIGNVFVHRDCRDAGVGSALLSAAIDEAKRRQLARLVLNPSLQSVPLYERAGFSRDHALLTLELD